MEFERRGLKNTELMERGSCGSKMKNAPIRVI